MLSDGAATIDAGADDDDDGTDRRHKQILRIYIRHCTGYSITSVNSWRTDAQLAANGH